VQRGGRRDVLLLWAAIRCPAIAGLAGYLFTGKSSGVAAGILAYSALTLFSVAARQYSRNDYWASKMARLHAEEIALYQALAEESRRAVAEDHDTQALIGVYRARLGLLQVRKKALRAGYLSYKAAGVFSHFSERKGGLLPDAG
jgi:hypothetical protein